VGTDDGLFRLQGDRLSRVDGRSRVRTVAVHDLLEDRRGRLWVGGSSLLMLDSGSAVEYSLEGSASEHRVKSILETRDGALWVGTVVSSVPASRAVIKELFGAVANQPQLWLPHWGQALPVCGSQQPQSAV